MPFRCDCHTDTWTFETTDIPVRTYIVMFMLRPGETTWTISVIDLTDGTSKRIALTSGVQPPTEQRAELVLRCYVDSDPGLRQFIQAGRRREN